MADFLQSWNGKSPINDVLRPHTCPLHTDAAGGEKGGGAYFQAGKEHHCRHTHKQRKASIAYLELHAVCLACHREHHRWAGCVVPLLCDNATAVQVLRKGSSKSPNLNELLRRILALCLHHDFVLLPHWISTHDNKLADHLSRFQVEQATPYMQAWRSYSASMMQLASTCNCPSRTTPSRLSPAAGDCGKHSATSTATST